MQCSLVTITRPATNALCVTFGDNKYNRRIQIMKFSLLLCFCKKQNTQKCNKNIACLYYFQIILYSTRVCSVYAPCMKYKFVYFQKTLFLSGLKFFIYNATYVCLLHMGVTPGAPRGPVPTEPYYNPGQHLHLVYIFFIGPSLEILSIELRQLLFTVLHEYGPLFLSRLPSCKRDPLRKVGDNILTP